MSYFAPEEIFERILDFLHDNRAALCSSSLVNRGWLLMTRYHLFGQIVLNEVETDDYELKDNVHSFLSLMQSPHSTIVPAIRNAVLNISTQGLIPDVVRELKRSQHLTRIMFMDHTHVSDTPSLSWISEALPNIEAFSYNTWYSVPDDAHRLFASFTRLQSLCVYTRVYTTFTFPHDIPIPQFLRLRTLRLRLLNSEQFLDWLQALTGFQPSLETFDLRLFRLFHSGWGPIGTLNTFLKVNSGSLQHLSLGIDYAAQVVDEDESVCVDEGRPADLSELSNLKSIFFRTHDFKAICDSLMTLHPSSKLGVLNVHLLHWKYGERMNPGGCTCAPSRFLERLESIMGDNHSFTGTAIHLRISKEFADSDPEFSSVIGSLRTGWQKRDLKMSFVDYDHEEDDQIDSAQSIRDLLLS
ncbi:hypothetical protein CPB84DRAFT_1776784 [Gymnopilus junonius]|uniref:F-box domain-containing protein n=1 Tax=Gymnopilus junonius TaxID=109634 RepID=A0A9P5NP60_GYMJU|nr:hypothetical protein CPB84DRAFT_1776784 [Gymnopilus junonius]